MLCGVFGFFKFAASALQLVYFVQLVQACQHEFVNLSACDRSLVAARFCGSCEVPSVPPGAPTMDAQNSWAQFETDGIVVAPHSSHAGFHKFCCACHSWATRGHLESQKHTNGVRSWLDFYSTDYDKLLRSVSYLTWPQAQSELLNLCDTDARRNMFAQACQEIANRNASWSQSQNGPGASRQTSGSTLFTRPPLPAQHWGARAARGAKGAATPVTPLAPAAQDWGCSSWASSWDSWESSSSSWACCTARTWQELRGKGAPLPLDLPVSQLSNELQDLRAMLELVSERQDAFDRRLQMLELLENRVHTVEAVASLWENMEFRIQTMEDLQSGASVGADGADAVRADCPDRAASLDLADDPSWSVHE